MYPSRHRSFCSNQPTPRSYSTPSINTCARNILPWSIQLHQTSCITFGIGMSSTYSDAAREPEAGPCSTSSQYNNHNEICGLDVPKALHAQSRIQNMRGGCRLHRVQLARHRTHLLCNDCTGSHFFYLAAARTLLTLLGISPKAMLLSLIHI